MKKEAEKQQGSGPARPHNRSWKGVAAAEGLAMGPAYLYDPEHTAVSTRQITGAQVHEEQERVGSAMRIVELELRKLARITEEDQNASLPAGMLDFHIDVLRDAQLKAEINEHIRNAYLPADRAVFQVFRHYIQRLETSGSAFFKERIPDIVDIRSRIIRRLQQKEMMVQLRENHIVVCREIKPSEIILFARQHVRGLVAERGGLTSHAAIIAKSMGIPFVLEVEGITEAITNDELLIVDGRQGLVIQHPDDQTRQRTRKQIEQGSAKQHEQQHIYETPGQTACGHRVAIRVNLELEAEIDLVQKYKPEGIGLLRTEAYFLDHAEDHGRDDAPLSAANAGETGQDQRRFLQRAAVLAGTQELTVRLFDIGGDKMPYHAMEKEENPFLGWRGVRVLLDKRQLLRRQLHLILETLHSYPCKLRLLVPMVSQPEELREIRKELKAVLHQLRLPAHSISLGAMIEVPAAALIADHLARHVDFMSIGTNDLTQYTMAADRNNSRVSAYFDSNHPALWRLIHRVSGACEKAGIPFGVCGEMASEPALAGLLVGFGAQSLSLSGPGIPMVRKALYQHRLAKLQAAAKKVLRAGSTADVRNIVESLKNPTS
ncbi:MAG: phosphoenolpyruvate--protein phosphotransferase [Cyclonatronaceae bacterium]